MKIEKMFEIATRTKMRFSFRGLISVEDLWDLSVENLDLIFKNLNSQLKQIKEESLLETRTQQDQELDTKIEIVKYIVKVKLEEANTRLKANERKEKKQKLLEILASKEEADLLEKDSEEIRKMIEELNS